jgi:hypothetical protein
MPHRALCAIGGTWDKHINCLVQSLVPCPLTEIARAKFFLNLFPKMLLSSFILGTLKLSSISKNFTVGGVPQMHFFGNVTILKQTLPVIRNFMTTAMVSIAGNGCQSEQRWLFAPAKTRRAIVASRQPGCKT